VIDSLAALRKHRAFRKSELGRFTDLSKENHTTTNSYLLSALDAVETNQAGRRFRQRLAQERSDDPGKRRRCSVGLSERRARRTRRVTGIASKPVVAALA